MASITFNLNQPTIERLNRLVTKMSRPGAPKTKTAVLRDALKLYEEAHDSCLSSAQRAQPYSMGAVVHAKETHNETTSE